MTITTAPCRVDRGLRRRTARRDGYSLLELIIATTLGALVSTAVFSLFLFVARSSLGIVNYSEMNTESRFGLELLGRDVRSAQQIASGFSEETFELTLPGGATVSYRYRPEAPGRPLVREDPSGEETVILSGVEALRFLYFDLQGGSATVPLHVKQIQLQTRLVRRTVSFDNTERVVSARYVLRNKEVGH